MYPRVLAVNCENNACCTQGQPALCWAGGNGNQGFGLPCAGQPAPFSSRGPGAPWHWALSSLLFLPSEEFGSQLQPLALPAGARVLPYCLPGGCLKGRTSDGRVSAMHCWSVPENTGHTNSQPDEERRGETTGHPPKGSPVLRAEGGGPPTAAAARPETTLEQHRGPPGIQWDAVPFFSGPGQLPEERNCYKPLGCLQPTGAGERARGWCRSPRGTRVPPPHSSTAAWAPGRTCCPSLDRAKALRSPPGPRRRGNPSAFARRRLRVQSCCASLSLPCPGPQAREQEQAALLMPQYCALVGRGQESTGPRPGRGECT
ncbi:unnamed protein product [Rangifer tarandus platyrhynchus]|uniref:Uncharacterized protein n=1 Tax=Rangifer tarandus platyrhynchus TaxID=3082113 RepID=A0AC59YSL8_RANTA